MTASRDRPPVAVAFGARARALRLERPWTLDAMAARTGLTVSAICRVERGQNSTLATAEKIADAFGMPLPAMLAPDSCSNCYGAPGRGFTCQVCGAKGPEVTG